MNTPPRYQIFHDLSMEVAKLIANLEIELRNKLNSAPTASGSAFKDQSVSQGGASGKKWTWPKWKGLRGFGNWLWTGKAESVLNFYNKKRPTLKEYVENEKKIDEIFQEIIKENFNLNLNEQYDQISEIFDKFKKDFFEILKKYAALITKEQEKEEIEKSELAQKSGSPETASEEDIARAYQRQQMPVSNDLMAKLENLNDDDRKQLLDGLLMYKEDPSIADEFRDKEDKNELEKLFFQIIDENKVVEVLSKYINSKATGVGNIE